MGKHRESQSVNSSNLRPRRSGDSGRNGAKIFWFALFAVIVVVIASVGVTQVGRIQNYFAQFGVVDYPGPGSGEAIISIHPGDTGEEVANDLVKANVVKDFKLIYKVIIAVANHHTLAWSHSHITV